MTSTVVFDMDGTITTRDSMLDLVAAALLTDPARIVRLPLGFVAGWWLAVGRRDRAKEALLRMALGGRSREDVAVVARRAAATVPLDPVIVRRIEEHLAAGDTVWIASASPRPIVEAVARRVGVGNVVATELRYEGAAATGAIEGENCRAVEKLHRLDSALPEGWRESAIAYSDDLVADGPLLGGCTRGIHVTRSGMQDVGLR